MFFEASLELYLVLASSIGDDRYNDRYPVSISPEHRAKVRALDDSSLAAVRAVDPKQLDQQRRLSRKIFIRAREHSIEGNRFPTWLMPLHQAALTHNALMHNAFAQLGSGSNVHPFKRVKDYDDFLKRIDGFVAWTDQAIANMREGVQKGWVQPKVVMEKTLPQLEAHIKDGPTETVYWQPIKSMPADFSAADRTRLEAADRDAIATKVVPVYRKLHDFVKDEYLPKCRDVVSIKALPDGEALYAYLVKVTTTIWPAISPC